MALPEVVGAKEACDLLVCASGNLRAMLRANGIPEPAEEWAPGVQALQLASGAIWELDVLRPLIERRAAERAAESQAA